MVLAAWVALLAVSAGVAWRRRARPFVILAVIGVVSLLGAVAAAASIPRTIFRLVPQNYLWMWPTGIFLTCGVAAGVLAEFPALRRWLGGVGWGDHNLHVQPSSSRSPLRSGTSTSSPRYPAPRPPANGSPGRSWIGSRIGLRRYGVTGPVAIDNASRAAFGSYVPYSFLAELQEAGIEFTFPADDGNLLPVRPPQM